MDARDRAMREDVYMPRRKRRNFTAEQRADAVRKVREAGNLAKVARDLDLTEAALRNLPPEYSTVGGFVLMVQVGSTGRIWTTSELQTGQARSMARKSSEGSTCETSRPVILASMCA